MTMEATGTYLDYIRTGERLHQSVKDICVQLEKEGWRVEKRLGSALRYWCPRHCGRSHGLWVDLAKLTDERLEFQLARSCFTFS